MVTEAQAYIPPPAYPAPGYFNGGYMPPQPNPYFQNAYYQPTYYYQPQPSYFGYPQPQPSFFQSSMPQMFASLFINARGLNGDVQHSDVVDERPVEVASNDNNFGVYLPERVVRPAPRPDDVPDQTEAASTATCPTCQHGYDSYRRLPEHVPLPVRRPRYVAPKADPKPRKVAADKTPQEAPPGIALPHASTIEANLKYGLTAPDGWCGLAVWRVLLKAGLVRGSWEHSGADAIGMGKVLRANGFKLDMSVCNRPGVVRIYSGNQSGHHFPNHMAGDTAGHIEIFGLDHQYHSFYSSPRSITQSMKIRFGYSSRRPLKECWYKP